MILIYVKRTFYSETGIFGRIFKKLSNMNKSIQSPQINMQTQYYKINAFTKKLGLWKRNIERNIVYMFPTSDRPLISETEAQKTFIRHLDALQKQFSSYFKGAYISTFEWFRDPFAMAFLLS
jgi:hypothetical protein